MTLPQHLRALLAELDARAADDNEYKAAFSTYTKQRLRRGETWRHRLTTWADKAEADLIRIR